MLGFFSTHFTITGMKNGSVYRGLRGFVISGSTVMQRTIARFLPFLKLIKRKITFGK